MRCCRQQIPGRELFLIVSRILRHLWETFAVQIWHKSLNLLYLFDTHTVIMLTSCKVSFYLSFIIIRPNGIQWLKADITPYPGKKQEITDSIHFFRDGCHKDSTDEMMDGVCSRTEFRTEGTMWMICIVCFMSTGAHLPIDISVFDDFSAMVFYYRQWFSTTPVVFYVRNIQKSGFVMVSDHFKLFKQH